jgi:Flp pilus assembly pilin Flp
MLTRLNSVMHRGRNRISIRDESGQGLVEYALIIAIVSLGAIASLTFLKGSITGLFSKAGSSINLVEVGSGGTGTGTGTGGPAPGAPTITSTNPVEGSSGSTAAFTTPSMAFTAGADTTSLECRFDAAAYAACTSPVSPGAALGNGAHSFSVRGVGPGGTGTATVRSWTVTAAAAVPTPGAVSIDCPGSGQNCDRNEDATATTSGWNANGSAITGYYFEWYTKSNPSCSESNPNWGSVDDRDPNSGTDPSTTQDFGLPFSFGDYAVRVVVHAANGVGTSTAVAEVCATVNA